MIYKKDSKNKNSRVTIKDSLLLMPSVASLLDAYMPTACTLGRKAPLQGALSAITATSA